MTTTARGRLAKVSLLAYAIVNVVLYSMLLPLWEGFDEPFHFGYVQGIANGTGFQDPRRSRLSEEVARSIALAPASLSVKRNLPDVTAYPEFFALPDGDREARRDQLFRIDPKLRWQRSKYLNYEGLQAPLAYAILALPERTLARMPLPDRVLVLRIISGSLASLLLLTGTARLAAQLELSPPYSEVLGFCVFSSQMIWATVAHVGNDWLAVPLAVWFLVSVIDYHERTTMRRIVACASILSLGLLTKAYFLALAPLVGLICILGRNSRHFVVAVLILVTVTGRWYYRNLTRYGTISGMQELREGINPTAAIGAARIEKVAPAIDSYLREALWTGNNTFRSFSVSTLRALIIVWLAGLVLWGRHRRASREWIIVGYGCLFAAALGYDAAINFVASHGETISPGAWYTQVLLVPMLALALLGASRAPRIGRLVAAAIGLLFGYVIVVTYWAKLIPLYSGIASRTSLLSLLSTYRRLPGLLAALGDVSLGPSAAIFIGACLVTFLSAGQAVAIALSLLKGSPESITREGRSPLSKTGPAV
jgi:hypothetical protein